MKLLKGLAQYYVDLTMRLGLIRFSLLLASALVCISDGRTNGRDIPTLPVMSLVSIWYAPSSLV